MGDMAEVNIGKTGEIIFRQTNNDDEIDIYEGAMKLHSAMDLFQKPETGGRSYIEGTRFPAYIMT